MSAERQSSEDSDSDGCVCFHGRPPERPGKIWSETLDGQPPETQREWDSPLAEDSGVPADQDLPQQSPADDREAFTNKSTLDRQRKQQQLYQLFQQYQQPLYKLFLQYQGHQLQRDQLYRHNQQQVYKSYQHQQPHQHQLCLQQLQQLYKQDQHHQQQMQQFYQRLCQQFHERHQQQHYQQYQRQQQLHQLHQLHQCETLAEDSSVPAHQDLPQQLPTDECEAFNDESFSSAPASTQINRKRPATLQEYRPFCSKVHVDALGQAAAVEASRYNQNKKNTDHVELVGPIVKKACMGCLIVPVAKAFTKNFTLRRVQERKRRHSNDQCSVCNTQSVGCRWERAFVRFDTDAPSDASRRPESFAIGDGEVRVKEVRPKCE